MWYKKLLDGHKQLGHISRNRIEQLIKDGILVELDFSSFETFVDCIEGKLIATILKGNLFPKLEKRKLVVVKVV